MHLSHQSLFEAAGDGSIDIIGHATDLLNTPLIQPEEVDHNFIDDLLDLPFQEAAARVRSYHEDLVLVRMGYRDHINTAAQLDQHAERQRKRQAPYDDELDTANDDLSETVFMDKPPKPKGTRRSLSFVEWVTAVGAAGFCLGLMASAAYTAGQVLKKADFAPSVAGGIVMVLPILSGLLIWKGLYLGVGTTPKHRHNIMVLLSVVTGVLFLLYAGLYGLTFPDAIVAKGVGEADGNAPMMLTLEAPEEEPGVDFGRITKVAFLVTGVLLESTAASLAFIIGDLMLRRGHHTVEIKTSRRNFLETESDTIEPEAAGAEFLANQLNGRAEDIKSVYARNHGDKGVAELERKQQDEKHEDEMQQAQARQETLFARHARRNRRVRQRQQPTFWDQPHRNGHSHNTPGAN